MKKALITLTLFLFLGTFCFAQEQGLLIDDFEGRISGGSDGTVDFGAGGDSTLEVTRAEDIKYSGKQSLKANYDAVSGGYMWIARGFGLDVKNTQWLAKPEDIDWAKYNAIAFYMYGSASKHKIALDLKDSGQEMWRFIYEDNFKGWRRIICPFAEFFARGDWQPDAADKNANLDFPLKSYQFEPLPEGKGALYFDYVELIKQ